MLLDAASKPAGGAAFGEVIIASIIGLGLTVLVLGLVWLHRSGRSQILTRGGTRLGNATGVPPWVALPTVLTTASLLCALFGMLWDGGFKGSSQHRSFGRRRVTGRGPRPGS